MLDKIHRPNIKGEMDELERVSQDLSRDEGIDVSVKELVNAFKKSEEETLTKEIWSKLENSESVDVKKGELSKVKNIAKKFNKTSPEVLAVAIKSGDYSRPLIVKFDNNRYHLVAGNTRLCTAAALGVEPKVFIADITGSKEEPKEASSAAQQAAIAIDMKKKGIKPKNESKEITGNKNIDKDLKGNQKDMVYGIVNIVKKVVDMDNRRKIADDMIKQFKKENINFDYNEFLDMCGCNKKIEAKEMTGADSAGAFSGPAFGGKKTIIKKIHNINEEEELDEVTDASSSGAFDVPLFGGTKGRKNPLSIGGPDTIYKGRAVKDKNFPKWGGPGGKFVKINDKCKKFPYCNQGDMSALELLETEEVRNAIQETAKKYGLPTKAVENLVLNQIKEIFI